MELSRIEIITGMSKFNGLKATLSKAGVRGMTVTQVLGCGIEKGTKEYEVDENYEMELLPKQQIALVVEKSKVDEIVELIKQELYTGHIGDGKIFVYDITNVIRVRTGDEGVNWSRKMNGLTKFGNVTLKWGMTSSLSFYDWVTSISQGTSLGEDHNKNVTITLFDDDGSTALAVWNLTNAWPSKYTAPDFNASSSEIAFESVELVYESMTRES